MGLLDSFSSPDMQLALGLLAAGGAKPVRTSFGEGLLGAVQGAQAYAQRQKDLQAAEEDRKQRQAMQAIQMQQLQRSLAQQQKADQQGELDQSLLRKSFAPLPGPTMDGGPLNPQFDPRGMLSQGGSLEAVNRGMQLNAALNPQAKPPEYKVVGNALVKIGGDGVSEAYRAPATESDPTSVREYKFAQSQGYKGSYQQFQTDLKKAGATNIGMPKIEIKTGEGLAGQIGPMVKDARAQAESGLRLVDSANRVLQAAEGGNLFAGPGANLMLKGAQVADVLGFGGKSTQEKITNTRNVVRGMAEQAVSARAQLGGQAQISNSEQEMLNKATSGDISELTAGEIVQIARLNDRLGRQLYGNYQRQIGAMQQRPDLQSLVPFYSVPEMPAPRKAGQSGEWSITPVGR